MTKLSDIDEPVNVEERYLHAMVVRLDALCHMMSSLMQHIAEKEKIALEKSTVVEKPTPRKRKPKEE